VERGELVRAGRRRQAQEALDFERARVEALREQLEVVVTELDGPALDQEIFTAMGPVDVAVVRPQLQPPEPEPFGLDEEEEESEGGEPLLSARELQEAEIERLRGEIAASAERQRAFERYLELLAGWSPRSD
jgi:hypothetical protein